MKTISIRGPIFDTALFDDEVGADRVIAEIKSTPAGDPILIEMNTVGGIVSAATDIYQTLVDHDGEVTVDAHGAVMSAGMYILGAADKRRASELADFMHHGAWTGVVGNQRDMYNAYEWLKGGDDACNKMLSRITNLSFEELAEMSLNEKFFNAEQALEWGLIHEIKPGAGESKQDPMQAFQSMRSQVGRHFDKKLYQNHPNLSRRQVSSMTERAKQASAKVAEAEAEANQAKADAAEARTEVTQSLEALQKQVQSGSERIQFLETQMQTIKQERDKYKDIVEAEQSAKTLAEAKRQIVDIGHEPKGETAAQVLQNYLADVGYPNAEQLEGDMLQDAFQFASKNSERQDDIDMALQAPKPAASQTMKYESIKRAAK